MGECPSRNKQHSLRDRNGIRMWIARRNSVLPQFFDLSLSRSNQEGENWANSQSVDALTFAISQI